MDLHITVHDEAGPGTRVLHLAGEAHQDNAGPLRAALADALDRAPAPRTLIVDCGGVTFCTSAGLNALLQARRTAASRGIALRLAGPRDQMARLLHLTEADTVFEIGPGLPSRPDPCDDPARQAGGA